MSRKPRTFKSGYAYHVTTRCNNREFKLSSRACREVFLYAIKQALDKFNFKLYALCIMSNHVHYLIEPKQPEDLPKIMHFLNWYTAMCFNRMLKRTGHFWEKRYFAEGFHKSDKQRALNTLRYIHGNPKAAKMRRTFFYEFSNYGSYEKLTDDGLTQWHPAFLQLGATLEDCARKYRGFCHRYQPKSKSAKKCHWGSRLLAGMKAERRRSGGASGGQSRDVACYVSTSSANGKPRRIKGCPSIHRSQPSSLADLTRTLRIDLGCGRITPRLLLPLLKRTIT